MSDYRFSTGEHNGIPCLHVLIDGEDGETHIPIDDIQAHFRQQGFKAKETIDLAYAVMQRARAAFEDVTSEKVVTESDIDAIFAGGLEDIIDMCQGHFPRVQTEEKAQ